jgi:maltooligosyltrehalose synthase
MGSCPFCQCRVCRCGPSTSALRKHADGMEKQATRLAALERVEQKCRALIAELPEDAVWYRDGAAVAFQELQIALAKLDGKP